MNEYIEKNTLIFDSFLPRLESKDQRSFAINKSLIMIMIIIVSLPRISEASYTCHGRFVNPITDVCWSCLLPISIGSFKIGGGGSPAKRDRKNPSSPICACTKANVPVPGISLGFWEPARMVDVTRTPFCMTGLGGIQMGPKSLKRMGTVNKSYGKRISHNSTYNLHYYIYPLVYWLELITDLICLEKSSFDVAYLSELDPTWNDSKLQNLLNPESFLFGNPLAQAACAIDCAASTIDMPRDSLFWCSGCWGNMYPWGGTNADHSGGVQTSSLLTTRILAKMHRTGLAKSTSTSSAKINGPICRKETSLKIKKSQYKIQMVYPKSTKGSLGCWPIGFADMAFSAFKEYPYDGEDWSYVIWRKRNCCAF
jgi:conjugal transfer pilus assembly protein TraU